MLHVFFTQFRLPSTLLTFQPPDETFLAPLFTVDANSSGLLVAAIQLVKASLFLEHQTASPSCIQILLLSALSELTANTNTLCTGASALTWMRAALRHEVLLLDLLVSVIKVYCKIN